VGPKTMANPMPTGVGEIEGLRGVGPMAVQKRGELPVIGN